jgi:hypothetical protein
LASFVFSWQEFSAIPTEITGASLKNNLQLIEKCKMENNLTSAISPAP